MEKILLSIILIIKIILLFIYGKFKLNYLDKRYVELNLIVLLLTIYWMFTKKYNLLNTISHSLFGISISMPYILVKSKAILTLVMFIIIVSVISRFLLNDCLFYYVKKYEKNVKKSLFEHQELNIDFILIIIAYLYFLKIINAEPK
tara:strand:+ start:26048 stop:26485 length:438 start_codon:yes stop_codon:yes gene_type:complete